MKAGTRVRPIELVEDKMHLDPGVVTDDWEGNPSILVRVKHDSGTVRHHTVDQLEVIK